MLSLIIIFPRSFISTLNQQTASQVFRKKSSINLLIFSFFNVIPNSPAFYRILNQYGNITSLLPTELTKNTFFFALAINLFDFLIYSIIYNNIIVIILKNNKIYLKLILHDYDPS